MMDYQDQLKLQAYLDGELTPEESQTIARRLAGDSEAAALLSELRQTRECLAGGELDVRLPESREFFWSKVRREIERSEAPARHPVAVPWMLRLRRVLMPAAALAVVGIATLSILPGPRGPQRVTHIQDSGALTYHDYSAGTTLVWLTYPADNEVADDDEWGILE